jgi:hypothetical protein
MGHLPKEIRNFDVLPQIAAIWAKILKYAADIDRPETRRDPT